jgi:hypothetical protein
MEYNKVNYDYIEILTNLVDKLNIKVNRQKENINKLELIAPNLITKKEFNKNLEQYNKDKIEILNKLSELVGKKYVTNSFNTIIKEYVSKLDLSKALDELKTLINSVEKPKDGKDGVDGKNGFNGLNGLDGKDGKNGLNGKDGINGKDGKDGVDAVTPNIIAGEIETINPDEDAKIDIIKKDNKYIINFKIPRGYSGGYGLDGKNGKDATINGVNTLNIIAGTNISTEQVGSDLTINATSEPQIQSDFAQEDDTQVDYIKNKPTLLSQFINDPNFISEETKLLSDRNITKDPTGIISDYDNNEYIDVSYNTTTRKITLNANITAYWRGEVIPELVSGWVSPEHNTGVTGSIYLYYNGTNYVWSTVEWKFYYLQIAIVEFDSAGTFLFAQREVHGVKPHSDHASEHRQHGTAKESGGTLGVTSYSIGSSTPTNRRPDINQTVLMDEDLRTINVGLFNKTYTTLNLVTTGLCRLTKNKTDFPLLDVNNPYYNQFTGGAWQQTLLTNNQYMCMWLIAVPVASDIESQKCRYIWIQGQSAGTLASQQALSTLDIQLGDFADNSPEYVFIQKVIIQYTGNNWVISQVTNLSGSRYSQVSAPAGNYLSTVVTNTTLVGDGTSGNVLSVAPNRVTNETNVASITPTTIIDTYKVLGQAQALTINNPTGTPTDEQKLLISITDDGTPRAITMGNLYYAGVEIPMPTTTVASSELKMLFSYCSTCLYWKLIATVNV